MTTNASGASELDEFFERGVRQVAERAKMAMDGLSMFFSSLISFIQMPELKEFASEEFKESLARVDIEELKQIIAKLSIASEALEYLQTQEILELLSTIAQREDLFKAYSQMALGLLKLRLFLEGKSSL